MLKNCLVAIAYNDDEIRVFMTKEVNWDFTVRDIQYKHFHYLSGVKHFIVIDYSPDMIGVIYRLGESDEG